MPKQPATKKCDPTPITLQHDPTAEEFAKLAWGLAHPVRVKIIRMLIGREVCMCGDIVDRIPLAQSTVSQHLKILKECGLIQGELEGQKMCYGIHPQGIKQLKKLIAGL